MSPLRFVSLAHSSRGDPVGDRRLDLLGDIEVTVLTQTEDCDATGGGGVRRISMPTRGCSRRASFPSLATALALLDPDVVHLHANADTPLAWQVARLCGAETGRGLVLEPESSLNHPGSARRLMSTLRARRTLARTHALVARTAGMLAAMRRLGFGGAGIVASRGQEPRPMLPATEARRILGIAPPADPVIGWLGPITARAGLADVVEALTASHAEVTLLVPQGGTAQADIIDRADALEVLHRVRLVPPDGSAVDAAPERPSTMDAGRYTLMLSAADALLVPAPDSGFDLLACQRAVEIAQVHGVPVICADVPEIADLVGSGGWQLPFGDPALLARLFSELRARPHLLHAAAAAAAANAQRRHSPEAAAAGLARAISAAASVRSIAAPRQAGGVFGLLSRRQPSRP